MKKNIGLLGILISTSLWAADNFPFRVKYPEVVPIEIVDLKAAYDKKTAIIVDVRSRIEYDVIHVKTAIHIPVANVKFIETLKELVSKSPEKIYAFYCNGITCLKAYEATKKANESIGGENFRAFDEGIPAWANFYPRETLLLGKVIENPEKQLIQKSEFSKLCLDFTEFKKQAAQKNTLVIDVRDHIQSTGKLPELENALVIPLDKFIPNFVSKRREANKTLFIFDQVGKQVRWLMYYLVENKYEKYYFLKNGATGVLGKQEYKN